MALFGSCVAVNKIERVPGGGRTLDEHKEKREERREKGEGRREKGEG
jgi:hypothetical protein